MNELSRETGRQGIVSEFIHRQPALAAYGALLLALTPFMLAIQLFDLRTFDGVDVWAKPTKFVVSVAVFALTTAWFFGYVRADRRSAPSLRACVAVIIALNALVLFQQIASA